MVSRLHFLAFVVLVASIAAGSAFAGEPIERSGKNSVSAYGSLDTTDSDELDDVTNTFSAGIEGTHIFEGGTFEVGAGVVFVGALADLAELWIVNPRATARINSPLFGPEENILFYAGGNVGGTYIEVDAGDLDVDEFIFSAGPRIGLEVYISPTVALQVDDSLTFNAGDDTGDSISNRVSIGLKILFGG